MDQQTGLILSTSSSASSSNLINIDPVLSALVAEKVIAENGNLVKLTEVERKIYYLAMCLHYDLDPWSNPFDYLPQKKDGVLDRLTLYPNIKAANAKMQQNNLTVRIVSRNVEITGKEKGSYSDYEVGWAECEVEVKNGKRSLTEIGVVEIGRSVKRGDAIMKAYTKARRRAVLAFCGLSDGGDSTISAEAIDIPTEDFIAEVVDTTDPGIQTYDRLKEVLDLVGYTFDQIVPIAKKIKANPDRLNEHDFVLLRDAIFASWGFDQGCFKNRTTAWQAYQTLSRDWADLEDEGMFIVWRDHIDVLLNEDATESVNVDSTTTNG